MAGPGFQQHRCRGIPVPLETLHWLAFRSQLRYRPAEDLMKCRRSSSGKARTAGIRQRVAPRASGPGAKEPRSSSDHRRREGHPIQHSILSTALSSDTIHGSASRRRRCTARHRPDGPPAAAAACLDTARSSDAGSTQEVGPHRSPAAVERRAPAASRPTAPPVPSAPEGAAPPGGNPQGLASCVQA